MPDETKDVENLKRLRDELKVRAHLFKAELKDEWEKLEKDWGKIQGELAPAKRAAKASAKEVGDATQLLVSTLKQGYERIKKSLPR